MSEHDHRQPEQEGELLLSQLRKRISGFPLPDTPNHNFNPREADKDVLQRLGIPAKPDIVREPERYRLWVAMFGRELHFIQFQFDRKLVQAAEYEPTPRQGEAVAAPFSSTRFETSRNWSGASIEANSDKTFLQIQGQWTVPLPAPPPGASMPAQEETIEYQCAAWIGLDGQRRYRNSSLPQIGTLQSVTVSADGTQTFLYQAWTQWWDRNDKNSRPVPIPRFPVAQGNLIACQLTVLDNHTVLLNIINESTQPPAHAAIKITAPSVNNRQLSISGATAEWILERPTDPDTRILTPFADYGSIDFTNCYAFEAAPNDGVLVEQDLTAPRFFRMYEVLSPPPRSSFISMPSGVDNNSFAVSYGDFDS
jgi:hypothetical protein